MGGIAHGSDNTNRRAGCQRNPADIADVRILPPRKIAMDVRQDRRLRTRQPGVRQQAGRRGVHQRQGHIRAGGAAQQSRGRVIAQVRGTGGRQRTANDRQAGAQRQRHSKARSGLSAPQHRRSGDGGAAVAGRARRSRGNDLDYGWAGHGSLRVVRSATTAGPVAKKESSAMALPGATIKQS